MRLPGVQLSLIGFVSCAVVFHLLINISELMGKFVVLTFTLTFESRVWDLRVGREVTLCRKNEQEDGH